MYLSCIFINKENKQTNNKMKATPSWEKQEWRNDLTECANHLDFLLPKGYLSVNTIKIQSQTSANQTIPGFHYQKYMVRAQAKIIETQTNLSDAQLRWVILLPLSLTTVPWNKFNKLVISVMIWQMSSLNAHSTDIPQNWYQFLLLLCPQNPLSFCTVWDMSKEVNIWGNMHLRECSTD